MLSRPVVLVVLALFLTPHAAAVLLPAVSPRPAWVVETVSDPLARSWWAPALDVHPDGAPVVAWDAAQADTWVAERVAGVWMRTKLPEPGISPAVAIDPSGVAHVVYSTHVGFVHAWRAGDDWQSQRYDGDNDIITTDLQVDAAGNLHFLYADWITDELKYLRQSDGVWQFPPVVLSTGGAHFLDLAIDPLGRPHVVTSKHVGIAYGSQDAGGAWQWTSFPSWAGAAIGIGPDGAPHMTYLEPDYDLGYARLTPSGWIEETVYTGVGRHSSIGVDAQGIAHIAMSEQIGPNGFRDPTQGHTYYFTKDLRGAWTRTYIDAEGVTDEPILRLDGNGVPHVAYNYHVDQLVNQNRGDIRLATPLDGAASLLTT